MPSKSTLLLRPSPLRQHILRSSITPSSHLTLSPAFSRRRTHSSSYNIPLSYVFVICLFFASLQSVVLAAKVKTKKNSNIHFSNNEDNLKTTSEGQHFAMEPQDQTAVVGSRVTLPCRVMEKIGALQWTKDDFGLGQHRNLSGFERYSMVGSDEEGDFSLDIFPVMLDDDARYQCQVGPGPNGEAGIRSRFAKLTVLVPPEAPKILQGDHLVTTEDREIELECDSVGGKPAAEVSFLILILKGFIAYFYFFKDHLD